ncbi:MAG: AI-2E family transporter [Flavisolibacter sp.]
MNGSPNNTIDSNLLRQIFFIAAIVFLGIVLFRQLWFFSSAFLGSVTFYVLMRKRMFYLTENRKWKRASAAAILMLLSFFVILVPIGILGNILYSKIADIVTHSGEYLSTLKRFTDQIEHKTGYVLVKSQNIDQLGSYLTQLLPKVLGVTINTLAIIAAMYFILFFMLVNGRAMEEALYEYIPLKDGNVELIGREVKVMVVSNTIGIPLIALIQGIVGLIGYLIIGIKDPWLWFVATSIAAMMPVVGAALIYVPLTVSLFIGGETGKGIAMAIWGFGFIGLVDNLFRFLLNKRLGDIHPLITIFGVIIGVQLFGFIGLIFGPLLISMFLLLLRIYSSEFIVKKREMHRVK